MSLEDASVLAIAAITSAGKGSDQQMRMARIQDGLYGDLDVQKVAGYLELARSKYSSSE